MSRDLILFSVIYNHAKTTNIELCYTNLVCVDNCFITSKRLCSIVAKKQWAKFNYTALLYIKNWLYLLFITIVAIYKKPVTMKEYFCHSNMNAWFGFVNYITVGKPNCSLVILDFGQLGLYVISCNCIYKYLSSTNLYSF